MRSKEVVCYAKCLGDCSDVQSREHYVSKGLWKNKSITFEGLPFLQGKPKTMNVEKVYLKILCQKHNMDLSIFDTEGIRFNRMVEKFHNNQFARAVLKNSALWKKDLGEIDGKKIERWIAKTAIGNLQEFPEAKWHPTSSPTIDPPKHIIESVYGLRDFEYPFGLYQVNTVGDKLRNEDHFSGELLYHSVTKGYVGSFISYRDWRFLINFSDIKPDDRNLMNSTGMALSNITYLYHPKAFRFISGNGKGGGKISGLLTFKW